MPELPEVQNVLLSLAPHLQNNRITKVALHRADIVHTPNNHLTQQHLLKNLLKGQTLGPLLRHGKQLALTTIPNTHSNTGRVICIHLGMTGSLRWYPPQKHAKNSIINSNKIITYPKHTHVIWTLEDQSTFAFIDPRRFGGIWCFESQNQLIDQRWSKLGPDALTIKPAPFHQKLLKTHRPLKSVLLDQSLIAGLDNIYVDELLFKARLWPLKRSNTLTYPQTRKIVKIAKQILTQAIKAGGSTFRDYVNADGERGKFQQTHAVYNRSKQPCMGCQQPLINFPVGGRNTVACSICQKEPSSKT